MKNQEAYHRDREAGKLWLYRGYQIVYANGAMVGAWLPNPEIYEGMMHALKSKGITEFFMTIVPMSLRDHTSHR